MHAIYTFKKGDKCKVERNITDIEKHANDIC
jgi:hypothetical protein